MSTIGTKPHLSSLTAQSHCKTTKIMEALELILGVPFACFGLYLIFRPNNNERWFKEKELRDYNEQFDRDEK
jgi:hypothetical protein